MQQSQTDRLAALRLQQLLPELRIALPGSHLPPYLADASGWRYLR